MPPGVDAWRIGELERVARTLKTQAAPHEIAAANSLRLGMSDMGMMLAPASFFAALIIGIAALTANRLFDVPRMAMAVAPTITMVPGKYALEMFALFSRGQMVEALQASASCIFIIGALAMALATARFCSSR